MKNYDYAIIGNCTSSALISSDCSIDWLCLPFFDSPSVFAKILDENKGGYFKVSAAKLIKIEQHYVVHTPILRTIFTTEDGVFELRDYMPRFLTLRDEYYCPPEIHRDILLISGNPEIIVELKPKPNYALSDSELILENNHLKITSQKGEYASFYLYSNLDYNKIIKSEPIKLKGTSFLVFSYHEKLQDVDTDKIYIEYEKTKTYWLDWVYRTKVPSKYKDLLIRSAITLKLLTYQRSGAVIAAPTTSLPEIIGKDRNWDYRYCWIRDASMIVDLYTRIGHMRSAQRYMNFVLNRRLLKHENISVMYGINGERLLTEKTLEHLSGYQGSKPVRIGNDAYKQVQNDIYGQLIEAIYTYLITNRRGRITIDEEIWTVVRDLANNVIKKWRQPDNGIWERRGELRHYVHSKVMSWVAMDRAAKIASFIGRPSNTEKWLKIASEIKQDILENGWDQERESFVMYYGSQELDAANLLMLHYGFLDKSDPRMVSTVKKTHEELTRSGFTFRYISEDEFGQPENAFIVCTFWMINALCLIGEEKKSREMLENILRCLNKFNLFSEDVEINSGRLTGNFPQGYSHLALIQTILLLETNYNWSDASAIQNFNI
ncbi:MAG: glycoside hydrolase family 15 protein [Candidatus Omnitrophica bacterium]|nr:glycoside hydrolase family 15 protein [Candidatus Omnitrophota bacterium]MBU2045024.1 glycoside hydrolase family 15 protein [Candidatus Omnitrophota bacterium]MBU2265794.1 glycoside hydrolase family 15 protein [Candidatus Omnitrophota bacterium]MBU2474280.1 glycoside hydrolase family 15 protein [Candidatus Omnitrophota bacterium]